MIQEYIYNVFPGRNCLNVNEIEIPAHSLFRKQMQLKMSVECQSFCSGGRLNKKDGLTRYGNSHVKDKTS